MIAAIRIHQVVDNGIPVGVVYEKGPHHFEAVRRFRKGLWPASQQVGDKAYPDMGKASAALALATRL